MNRVLIRSPACVRAAKRSVKKRPFAVDAIRLTLKLLTKDAFDPRLRTYKPKGSLAGYWASSAGHDLRIVFEFVRQNDAEAILFLSVGTHDEVY